MQTAQLILENGVVFHGQGFGATHDTYGEVVCNTSMIGYQEVLTDPSYAGQMVCMTYPLIGNYGINGEDSVSDQPQVRGVIVREFETQPSNFRSSETIDGFLLRSNIAAICGLDTRALTRLLREQGTMRGMIHHGDIEDLDALIARIKAYDPNELVLSVTSREMLRVHRPARTQYRVALVDFGVTRGTLQSLLRRGCEVTVFPADCSAQEILSFNPDGVMLSTGPGDPMDCPYAIGMLREMLGQRPLFGIGLGHQLLAIAAGARTTKMGFGHRGGNLPVKEVATGRTYITSQNHGYVVDETSLDDSVMTISHYNLNDHTVEGLCYPDYDAFTVQFHPEPSVYAPDPSPLYDELIRRMRQRKEGGV